MPCITVIYNFAYTPRVNGLNPAILRVARKMAKKLFRNIWLCHGSTVVKNTLLNLMAEDLNLANYTKSVKM